MPEDDPEQPPTDAEPPPEEAFALVSHEIRAEIIKILGEYPDENELSFSEIRSRLDTDVDPSGLHYHLQQLVGQFVAKTDDGYSLLTSGSRVLPPLRSGGFTPQQETMSGEAGFDCDHCGTPVKVTCADGWVEIGCPECEYGYFKYPLIYIPLDTFEDATAAFSQFRKYMALNDLFIARGVCPTCGRALDTKFHAAEDNPGDNKVDINQFCKQCRIKWALSVGEVLRADSELIGFCHEHGVDVLSTPHWELEFAATDEHVTVRSTDPWEVALEVTFDDETLELVVDGDLNVVERNRLDAPDRDEVSLPGKEACLEHLRRQRWPDGVTCPHCDSVDTIKKGKSKTDVQRYRCHTCDTIFNDLTGTIFAEHKLSLPEMLHIIQEMGETKTAQIVRQINRSYPAVLNFMDEVREARDADTEFDEFEFGETDAITTSPEENLTE